MIVLVTRDEELLAAGVNLTGVSAVLRALWSPVNLPEQAADVSNGRGIEVDDIEYHSSSLAVPGQLMLGFTAKWQR